MYRLIRWTTAALLMLLAAQVSAQLRITIPEGMEGGIPIAVVPFGFSSELGVADADIAAVVTSNLARSGDFDPLPLSDLIERPIRGEDVNFATWRALKADYLLLGRVQAGDDGYSVEYELFNVTSEQRLQAFKIPTRIGELRPVAHYISDLVYEKLTGVGGAFSTKIAYITAVGTGNSINYSLMVADSDGFNPQTVVTSREPLLSPAWSPDRSQIAYVSFESRNSSIWIQNVSTGARRAIASFAGINGAPAFSPDGRTLAVALSKSGNLEINLLEIETGKLTAITNHWAIDTEPVWTPDGQSIIFTSDRSGRPQIYEVSVNGGEARRLSFQGESNARPSVSSDGKRIAMAMGTGNVYRIAVLDRDTGRTFLLSPGNLDESPSFAPNGRMLLFASKDGGRGVLSAVSVNGRVRQKLVLADGDVREPAWSPLRPR